MNPFLPTQHKTRLTQGLLIFFLTLLLGSAAQAAGDPSALAHQKSVADALGLFSLIAVMLLIKSALVGSATLCTALKPQWVERTSRRISTRPALTLFVGLVDVLATLFFLRALLQHTPGRFRVLAILLALGVLLVLLLLALVGLAGVYTAIGKRMQGRDGINATLCGGITTEVATLLPLLGWVVQILLLWLGLGAGTLLLFERAPRGNSDNAAADPILDTEDRS